MPEMALPRPMTTHGGHPGPPEQVRIRRRRHYLRSEPLAALVPAALQHPATTPRAHARPEPVGAGPLALLGLVGALHEWRSRGHGEARPRPGQSTRSGGDLLPTAVAPVRTEPRPSRTTRSLRSGPSPAPRAQQRCDRSGRTEPRPSRTTRSLRSGPSPAPRAQHDRSGPGQAPPLAHNNDAIAPVRAKPGPSRTTTMRSLRSGPSPAPRALRPVRGAPDAFHAFCG
jgi:hypothetical protein